MHRRLVIAASLLFFLPAARAYACAGDGVDVMPFMDALFYILASLVICGIKAAAYKIKLKRWFFGTVAAATLLGTVAATVPLLLALRMLAPRLVGSPKAYFLLGEACPFIIACAVFSAAERYMMKRKSGTPPPYFLLVPLNALYAWFVVFWTEVANGSLGC